ncbi:hypothetical protein C3489_37235 [Streptomyces sp. Ru71]|uniref:AMIN-like domain-containing (lipo)protein n=1 Tax=Streptomyces sp. Ru71 TaxID=2080746 RepID=UPI000CDD7851|nr:hypothetical protein [Streptomyces sp. Ru71]POX43970.1 hypothetical protein C3489_37235 [Streptomyces sp. Ru71]
MHHRPRRTAAVAAALLTLSVAGATASASATPQSGAVPRTALVTNARWAGHCTYDRLVIDVRGKLPPVTVTPVKQLRYDASGKRVPLPGHHFLSIKLSPAAAHDMAGRSVYRGPRLVTLRLPQLKGLALTGDFEGVVSFGAAFHSRPHYRTFALHSPERFVLDVRHGNVCR